MSPIKLLRTTAFRLSLLYACLYSLVSAGGLGFIYWSTASHIQVQIDTRLQLETQVLLNLYQDRALQALLDAIRQRSQNEGQPRIFFYRLLGSAAELPVALQTPEQGQAFATLRLDEVFPFNQPGHGDEPVRVLATYLFNGQVLLVGRDLNDERRLLDHTLSIVVGVTALIFCLVILGSALQGYQTLRRIDAVSHTAGEIMAGDLTRRIPITARNDEFDLLGQKLNAMLERIEQLMAGMRQVTDNIAHDLRSPLNRLRNRLEVTLLEARRAEEYRTVLEQAVADMDGLLSTFNALLNIAQAEAGVRRNEWTELELGELAGELAELYEAVAEEKGIRWRYSAEPAVYIHGDRQLLAQAVSNLLDNALKYTPAGGYVALTVSRAEQVPLLSVADSGPGIPAEDRERVLERFVRLDRARSQPGNGLGLSLVKAVAKLHNARLVLEDNHPGLRVSLRFQS
jgi:signal transduction histidine kinase